MAILDVSVHVPCTYIGHSSRSYYASHQSRAQIKVTFCSCRPGSSVGEPNCRWFFVLNQNTPPVCCRC